MPGDPGKWANEPIIEGGHIFDSLAERDRYRYLRARLLAGEIRELKVHPPYSLDCNDIHIANYTADFSYREGLAGDVVVEDVKSPASRTPVYRLKRRLMLALHGIRVQEVDA
jgi:hypothetical protein